MSRAQQLQAIRDRYATFDPGDWRVAGAVQVFTRGEVGILLEEIQHLTLLLADLHASSRRSINASPSLPSTKVINGVLHERRPDGNWQAVMGLE